MADRYDALIDGESIVALSDVAAALPVMHLPASGAAARCGAHLPLGSSRIRYDHARLFARPCVACFRGVGLRPD